MCTVLQHPGGSEVILRYAGKNATQAFDAVHSINLLKTLNPNQTIGEFEELQNINQIDEIVKTQSITEVPDLSQVLELNDIEKLAEKNLKPKAWGKLSSPSPSPSPKTINLIIFTDFQTLPLKQCSLL